MFVPFEERRKDFVKLDEEHHLHKAYSYHDYPDVFAGPAPYFDSDHNLLGYRIHIFAHHPRTGFFGAVTDLWEYETGPVPLEECWAAIPGALAASQERYNSVFAAEPSS